MSSPQNSASELSLDMMSLKNPKCVNFQPVELRYCLGDGLLRSKTIKNSNLSRDEKVTFHFDPLPNRLCFLADCMFPGRPICIDVLDAGHQDYLGTIQRSHDNLTHCMSHIGTIREDSSNRPGTVQSGPLVSSSTV